MTDLTPSQARALRLKIADRQGDIANAQHDIDAMRLELGEPVQPLPPAVPDVPAPPVSPPPAPPPVSINLDPSPMSASLPTFKDAAGPKGLVPAGWNNPFNPSTWSEPNLMGDYWWRAENATFDAEGALNLRLTETPKAVGQVQAGDTSFATDAIWEADVVIGKCLPGLIQAPLWLYKNDTYEEINIEIVGVKGMTAAVAANVGGKRWVWDTKGYLLTGDLSGWTGRLAIRYRAGQFIRFYINGEQVAEATPANSTMNGGGFPVGRLKSYHQLWPANYAGGPGWAGTFKIPTEGSTLKVKSIGFRKAA